MGLLAWVSTGGLVAALSVIAYFLTHPDDVQKWNGILGSAGSWINIRFERRAVSGTITFELDSFAKAINKLVPSSLPLGIKIRWVTDKEEAFLDKNQVVLLMRQHKNNARNLANACMLFMSEGLLPTQRLYVDNDLMKAFEIVMAEKALLGRNRPDALRILNAEIVANIGETSPSVLSLRDDVKELDSNGFFTNVLIPEIAELPTRIQGVSIPTDFHSEVRDFVSFLRPFARHEIVPSTIFQGRCIRTAIILIGIHEKVIQRYVEPYLQAINFSIERAVHRDYLLALGSLHVAVAKQVGVAATKVGFGRVVSEREFAFLNQRGRVVKGVAIAFDPVIRT